jgi:hypothetical protein
VAKPSPSTHLTKDMIPEISAGNKMLTDISTDISNEYFPNAL